MQNLSRTSEHRHGQTRVHWNQDEKRSLAQKTARALIAEGVNIIDDEPSSYEHMMLRFLRDAIEYFPKERRRIITGVVQVSWLRPMMKEMVLATRGESTRFKPNVLDEPRSFALPMIRPIELEATKTHEKILDSFDEDCIIPEGYCLVSKDQWNRLQRYVKITNRKVDHTADLVAACMDLVIEALPFLGPKAELPEVPSSAPVKTDSMPLIVVTGLRARDQDHVASKVGNLAELVFVDSTKHEPESIGSCDWLIATRFCGNRWLTRANRVYHGKFSTVNSISGVVNEIRRLRE